MVDGRTPLRIPRIRFQRWGWRWVGLRWVNYEMSGGKYNQKVWSGFWLHLGFWTLSYEIPHHILQERAKKKWEKMREAQSVRD